MTDGERLRSSSNPPTLRKLRVTVISQYFSPEAFPINGLVEGLVRRGHKLQVFTGLPNYPSGSFSPGYSFKGPWTEQFPGFVVKRVPLVPRGKGARWRIALNHLSFAVMGLVIGPWRLRDSTDVIFAVQPSPLISVLPALLIAKLHRKPLVIWVQDLWPESLAIAGIRNRWLLAAMDRIMRLVYRSASLVLVQSRAFVDHALRYGVELSRIHYLPNWADPRFKVIASKDALDEDRELPQGFRVLFAGNIGDFQSIETIVDAAERLKNNPSIRIIAMGDGRKRKWLETEIRRRSLAPTLSYIGQRPLERMPKYNAVADALLVSLRANPTMAQTIPSRLQACLASGRPILASLDGEAQRIIIEAGAGICAPAEDADGLARAILSMQALGAEEREGMARAARRYYEHEFDRESMLDRVEACLQELSERSR